MVRPTQDALLTRRIGVLEIGLFAHRRYVEAYGVPSSVEALSEHRFIGFDRDAHAINSAGGVAAQLRREHFGFRCDSGPIQVAALHAGVGIGGQYVIIARRDPNLVPVLEKTMRFRREMWVAMHRDSRSTRRFKLLFDHLVQELAAKIK
jgi:DNA-binding transcriptional LysR family regulator